MPDLGLDAEAGLVHLTNPPAAGLSGKPRAAARSRPGLGCSPRALAAARGRREPRRGHAESESA
eukprot:5923793-Pyramimonas_sp.AAC.1